MANYYTYKEIVAKARALKNGAEKEKKLITTPKWSY